MKKYLILYYSKTGNSKFIAEKLSSALDCDIKQLNPAINNLLLLYLLSLLKINVAIGISRKDVEEYKEVIILGPIWGGLLISPLRSILKKCVNASKLIHFAVSCETPEEEKDSKYGYAQVLREAENIGGALIRTTGAFSTALVKGGREASNVLVEKTKFTEENFKGAIRLRFDDFLTKIKP